MIKLLFNNVDAKKPVLIENNEHVFTPGEDNLFTLLDTDRKREVSWVMNEPTQNEVEFCLKSAYKVLND